MQGIILRWKDVKSGCTLSAIAVEGKTIMECPACRNSLVVMEFKDVEVDFCPACGGCWMDRGELALILHGALHLPDGWEVALERAGDRRCPHCRKKMRAGPLPGTRIEVDACPHHGLWLDAGELQAVARSQGDRPEWQSLATYCDEVFAVTKRKDG